MITRRNFTKLAAASAATSLIMPVAHAEGPTRLRMKRLYDEASASQFSADALALAGKPVEIWGYMAPPLKVNLDFFILSDFPTETCPFCASEEDWIETIVFIRMRQAEELHTADSMIWTKGILDLGPATDPETGFVSRVRLNDATFGVV